MTLPRLAADVATAVRRDVPSVLRHGRHAPRWRQLVRVDPALITTSCPAFDPSWSGRVVGGDWDLAAVPLAAYAKIDRCRRHWIGGASWAEVGAYDELLDRIAREGPKDGCATADDVVRRFERLDAVFEQVRGEGRLRSRRELGSRGWGEPDGVLVHVDRHGRPVFGHRGGHRLAMAVVLGLRSIPAQLGVVHAGALPGWRDGLSSGPAADSGRPAPG